MKKLLSLLVLFIGIFSLSGCSCATVSVAYVSVATHDEEVVVNTSLMYSGPHIIVFEKEEDRPNPDDYSQPADYRLAEESNCAYYISFSPRQMGADTVGGKRVTLVDISQRWYEMTLTIMNDSYLDMDLYLNDTKLTPTSYSTERVRTYDKFTLNRSNDTKEINIIELK